MLLLQIENTINVKQNKDLLNQIYKNKKFDKKLKEKKSIVETFLNTKKLILSEFFYNLNTLETIEYTIGITLSEKNTFIYVTDINGQLRHYYSVGFSLVSYKKDKINLPRVWIELTNYILLKIPCLRSRPISFKLNNIAKPLKHLFKPILEYQFIIIQLDDLCFYAHNGCRPSKLKRKKRKKVIFE